MRDKVIRGWSHVDRCREIGVRCEDPDDTRSYRLPGAQLWVGSSGNWTVCREGLNTDRYEKAPVRCPCNRLVALNGVPLTITLFMQMQEKTQMT